MLTFPLIRSWHNLTTGGHGQVICMLAVHSWNGKLKIILKKLNFFSNYCIFMQIFVSFSLYFYFYPSRHFQMGPGMIWETTNQLSVALCCVTLFYILINEMNTLHLNIFTFHAGLVSINFLPFSIKIWTNFGVGFDIYVRWIKLVDK